MTTGRRDEEILNLIYELVYPDGEWPTYRRVDLHLDRELGIENTQTALLSIPSRLLRRPWQVEFNDNDEVRLTLHGIDACKGGPGDIEAFAQFLAWVCSRESTAEAESELTVTSSEYAMERNLELDVAAPESTSRGFPSESPEASSAVAAARNRMTRIRVLGMLLPSFWESASVPPERPWDWSFTINRRGLRPFRGVRNGPDLIRTEDELQLHLFNSSEDRSSALGQPDDGRHGTQYARDTAAPALYEVLLPVLRKDVAGLCAEALSDERYDDAIFTAFRHVEAEVQRRTGLRDVIGESLLAQAFDTEADTSRQIKISPRKGDQSRLRQMFSGAIGLHRGDRAHKDKASLVCRTSEECIRVLAHACVLLDLLDRDMAEAPAISGYDQREDDKLVLRVERATPTTMVLIDERPRPVLRRDLKTVIVSVAGISTGEHDVVLIDGPRQGPSKTISLIGAAGSKTWRRVEEVEIPLYGDEQCTRPLDVTGIRLTVRESGGQSQRIYPTRRVYTPGDYVTWQWDTVDALPRTWLRGGPAEASVVLFDSSALFIGEPTAAAHPARAFRVTLEPSLVKARVGEALPIRAAVWKTDGTAAWTEPIEGPKIKTDDVKTISVDGQKGVRAISPGRCTLRFEYEEQYAEATVEVTAHPRGTVADWVTALPPVSDMAWSEQTGLILATREPVILAVEASSGRLRPTAGIPAKPPFFGGAEQLAIAPNGDLAVSTVGEPHLLVLTANSRLSASFTVANPEPEAAILAFAWAGQDLILATSTQSLWRCFPYGAHRMLGRTPSRVKRLAPDTDSGHVLALTASQNLQQVWRVNLDNPQEPVDLLAQPAAGNTLSALALAITGDVYVTDFYAGKLHLIDENMSLRPVATDLRNPSAVACAKDGTLYVANLTDQAAVKRIMP